MERFLITKLWPIDRNHITTWKVSIFGVFLVRIFRHGECHIRSFSAQNIPIFELNTEKYRVSLQIQSECEKIRSYKTPNTVTFHVVHHHHTVIINTWPILCHRSLSIPHENIRKPLIFLIFLGGRERIVAWNGLIWFKLIVKVLLWQRIEYVLLSDGFKGGHGGMTPGLALLLARRGPALKTKIKNWK